MGYFDVIIKIHEPYYHHVFLLENLLIAHIELIHNYIERAKTAKGTNRKQKFKKTPNCKQKITKINVDNIGNLRMLSFGYILKQRLA